MRPLVGNRIINKNICAFHICHDALNALDIFSQAATVSLMVPVGQALGVPTSMLVGFYPASNGLFFVPTYGTLLAAVSFDQTGTTKVGKYLLNHSFMRPGLVTLAVALVISIGLSKLLLP